MKKTRVHYQNHHYTLPVFEEYQSNQDYSVLWVRLVSEMAANARKLADCPKTAATQPSNRVVIVSVCVLYIYLHLFMKKLVYFYVHVSLLHMHCGCTL